MAKKDAAGQSPANAIQFTGSIERVIYQNPENGYAILRVRPDAACAGRNGIPRDGLTCVGTMLTPQGGLKVTFTGAWVVSSRYGHQFSFTQAQEVMPAGTAGLIAYLASGLITGVGPDLASRIVKTFGDDTIDVLDNTPERLRDVRGIGKKNYEKITEAWKKHRCMCELMQKLQAHGISPAYGVRIYNHYGAQALDVVMKDPYRLAMDIQGIGFVTADSMARKLGIARDNPVRLQAGVLYTLQQAAESGHVYQPEGELVQAAVRQLDVAAELVVAAIDTLAGDDDPDLVIEEMGEEEIAWRESLRGGVPGREAPATKAAPGGDTLTPEATPAVPDEPVVPADDQAAFADGADGGEEMTAWEQWAAEQDLSFLDDYDPVMAAPAEGARAPVNEEALGDLNRRAVYLANYHFCESRTAYYLHRIKDAPRSVQFPDVEELVERIIRDQPFRLAPAQEEAVRMAARNKVMVLTGGPGTGKTTIIKAIIALFRSRTERILLGAPTGRAAKRMAEATGLEARTLHRMLEYNPALQKYGRDEDTPLACDLLIVDEASMMDVSLFYRLLKAVPAGAVVIFVGDIYQLPSVGPGAVLADIIASGAIPVSELNEIFRQSGSSDIVINAHQINRGIMPDLRCPRGRETDFYFMSVDTAEAAAQLIVDLVSTRLPRYYHFNPVTDIQVLTPMHRGPVGSTTLNAALQEALNPKGYELRRGERRYRVGDKVMQIKNNYDRDVFNGDMGCVMSIDMETRTVDVMFDGVRLPYEFSDLDEIVPAYAISIHKSQGSEYPAVVIPLLMSHYIMLQRNLVYTGITRGKRLVVLVGEQRALERAVRNNETEARCTRLAWRLSH